MKYKFSFTIVSIIFTFNSYAGGFTNGLNLTLDERLFVFAAVGTSKLDVGVSLASNATLSNGTLDESGGIGEIGAGYKYSEKIFTTLSLQENKLAIADIHNIYGSVNYQINTKNVKPFIGALVGHSRLKWSTPPHQVQLNRNLTSKSFMYGVQMGVEKEFHNNLSLFIKYQFIKHDHKLEVVDNTTSIEHNSEQNLLLGLQYLF